MPELSRYKLSSGNTFQIITNIFLAFLFCKILLIIQHLQQYQYIGVYISSNQLLVYWTDQALFKML